MSNSDEAGYAYCAIASLAHLNRLPNSNPKPTDGPELSPGLTDLQATIRWLVSRQVGFREEDASDNEEESQHPEEETGPSTEEEDFVGFNGRCNKNVDTCYAFWVIASLNVTPTSFSHSNLLTQASDVRGRTLKTARHRRHSALPL